MKRLLLILLICSLLSYEKILMAQDSDTIQVTYPGFQLLRTQEDYAFLGAKSSRTGFWEKLKYVPTGQDSYLSLGGDFRSEFQNLNNEDWVVGNDDMPLYLRFMLHADWHLGERWRVFGQLKSGHAIGRNGPPLFLNVDRLDFHQLFLSFQFGDNELEIGRRELTYGSRRLISIREGTNVRQSFDGLRWIWRREDHRLDLLFYAYNPQEAGVFDNDINTDQLLWGAYYVWNAKADNSLNFDFYYLGVDNEITRFEQGSSTETRHSFGLRHWGEWGQLSYNNEALVQFGRFGQNQINAWTISTELNYQLPGKLQLTPGIKAEVISGDRDPNDDALETFNPLYPRGGYFGLLAVIGPANLMDIHPSLKMKPAKGWMLNLDWDFFWRHQLGDGIYFPSGRLNVAGNDSDERFIGHQAGIQLAHGLNRFLEIEASYFYFFAGPFLKDVREGANFSQFGSSLNFKF